MRHVTLFIVALALAGVGAPVAGAHSFGPAPRQLEARIAFQERVVAHDLRVLRSFTLFHPLARPDCELPWKMAWYRHAGHPLRNCLLPAQRRSLERELAFHRAQYRWTVRELAESRLALVRRADASWYRALVYTRQVFPAQAGWVQSCSSSEGASPDGLRAARLTMNRQGSGAGGPMQFMSGTFYGNVDGAAAEVRRRGFRFLSEWRSWSSYAGQALTAAWMRWRGTDRGQWTGLNC